MIVLGTEIPDQIAIDVEDKWTLAWEKTGFHRNDIEDDVDVQLFNHFCGDMSVWDQMAIGSMLTKRILAKMRKAGIIETHPRLPRGFWQYTNRMFRKRDHQAKMETK